MSLSFLRRFWRRNETISSITISPEREGEGKREEKERGEVGRERERGRSVSKRGMERLNYGNKSTEEL